MVVNFFGFTVNVKFSVCVKQPFGCVTVTEYTVVTVGFTVMDAPLVAPMMLPAGEADQLYVEPLIAPFTVMVACWPSQIWFAEAELVKDNT